MKLASYQFAGGKFYTMFFTPNSPLFDTSKLLIPMQEVSIKMYFNDPSVFMMSAAATDAAAAAAAAAAKALSDDAIKITLNLCQVTVAPSLYRQITSARTRSTDRRSPFAFEKFGLTLIRMTINGEEYPYKNVLELVHNDGSKDNFGYRRLLETMASYQTGESPIVLPEMWGQSSILDHAGTGVVQTTGNVTMFAFNFTPDGRPAAPTFHPPQSGNVRLQFKLNASAGHAITVLIFAEFENVMEIDNNNGVLYHHDS